MLDIAQTDRNPLSQYGIRFPPIEISISTQFLVNGAST